MSRPPEPGATRSRYSGGAIAFHWVIALLIVLNIVGALASEDWAKPARGAVMGLHQATGITILVLSLLRGAWRLAHRPPPFPDAISRWERVAARSVHGLFYVLMIAIPLTGWLMISASAKPRPFSWYGLFDLPHLPVQGNKGVGGFAHEGHELLAYALIALLVLHVAAALKHHFADAPGFVRRMWPQRAG